MDSMITEFLPLMEQNSQVIVTKRGSLKLQEHQQEKKKTLKTETKGHYYSKHNDDMDYYRKSTSF